MPDYLAWKGDDPRPAPKQTAMMTEIAITAPFGDDDEGMALELHGLDHQGEKFVAVVHLSRLADERLCEAIRLVARCDFDGIAMRGGGLGPGRRSDASRDPQS